MTDRLSLAVAELIEALAESVRAEAAAVPAAPDRLYSIPETCEALGGVGRSFLYGEIAAGRIASVKAGRRRLLSASAIRAYIAEASS